MGGGGDGGNETERFTTATDGQKTPTDYSKHGQNPGGESSSDPYTTSMASSLTELGGGEKAQEFSPRDVVIKMLDEMDERVCPY